MYYIANSERKVVVRAQPTDSVARVKAQYVASGKAKGGHGCVICLKSEGREMIDSRLVGEYADPGGVFAHVEGSSHSPYRDMNYEAMASDMEAQAARHGGQGAAAAEQERARQLYKRTGKWGGKWDKGDEYLSYPNVVVGAGAGIWEAAEDHELVPSSPAAAGAARQVGSGTALPLWPSFSLFV